MLGTIKKMLGMVPIADLGEVLAKGGVIIDVRTPVEFAAGHLKRSVNIPLSDLSRELGKLNKDVPVITCCASGMRSVSAKSIFISNGFREVYNAGSWQNLKKYDQ